MAKQSSRSPSRESGEFVGDCESRDASSGLRELERDREREHERRASSGRTLAVLESAIASTDVRIR